MTTAQLVASTRILLQTQEFHHKQATHYFQLFNAYVPADGTAIAAPTPMQQFFQRMCEYHSAAALKISKILADFEQIVDA